MGVSHVFKIVQMVPNRANNHISSFLLSIVFVLKWLFLHWEVLMLLFQFPLAFLQTQMGMPLFIAQIAIIQMRDVPWLDIFKLAASTASVEFCEKYRFKLMYIFSSS